MAKKLTLITLILAIQTCCLAKEYAVYELIALEYSPNYPGNSCFDLNNNGLAAGWASGNYCEDGRFPALYSLDNGCKIINIGDQNDGMAWGINDHNQAVGFVSDSSYCDYPRGSNSTACLFNNDANGYISLWNDGVALAINNSGHITGYIKDISNGNNIPVFYGPGPSLMLLENLPGYTNGCGQSINEQNIIVANYYDSNYAYQAVMIKSLGHEIIELDDLGGGISFAAKINDTNQIVGYSYTEEQKQHAVIYNDRQEITDIGVLDGFDSSCAVGINNKGQVVGYSSEERICDRYPFESAVGTIFDTTGSGNNININDIIINNNGWIVRQLVDINEEGWILGLAEHKTTRGVSVLLKPIICKGQLQGDVNKDCRVNLTDLALLSSNWLECNFADPNYCN